MNKNSIKSGGSISTRRQLLSAGAAILALCISLPVRPQIGAASSVVLLKELADRVGAAADALTKIVDSLTHLVTTGAQGYNAVHANLVYDKLRNTSALASSLVSSQLILAKNLGEYAESAAGADQASREVAWAALVKRVQDVLTQVLAILNRVREDRSDFVLEPAYAKLSDVLQARVSLLQRIQSMPAPSTPEELQSVREIANRYNDLIAQLQLARDEMNVYVKSIKH